MKLVLSCLILILGTYTSQALASGVNQCRQAGKKSQSKCDDAITAQEAAGATRAAGVTPGTDINKGSQTQSSQIGQQMAGIEQALASCRGAKQSCEGECDAAQPVELLKETRQQINNAKSSDCTTPIDGKISKLEAAKAKLASDQAASNDTDSSSGAPMMMPPPPEKETPEDTVIVKNCEKENLTGQAECDAHFLPKCEANQGATGCKEFADRYCALSSTVYPGASGAGKGSLYCQKAVAHNYCIAGRESCLTCQNYLTVKAGYPVSNTPEQIEAARATVTCNEDPLAFNGTATASSDVVTADASLTGGSGISTGYSTASVSAQKAGDRVGGASSDSTDGSGYASASASATASASAGAGFDDRIGNAVGASSSAKYSSQSASSGHGAVSEGTNSIAAAIADQATRDAFRDRIGGSESHIRTPSSFESSMVADVATEYGGNLFKISSTTIRSMCDQRRLNCRARAH